MKWRWDMQSLLARLPLLENSRLAVGRVAEAVGYQGATALRRLMKKVCGFNPSRFRTSV